MMYTLLISLVAGNIIERLNNIRLGGGTLKLTWQDCGDASCHSKVAKVTPDTLTLGSSTTVTGTGTLNEDTAGGNYAIQMKAGFITENWSGDICVAKTFDLPLGMGSVKFDGMACPLTAGAVSVSMDITMSSAIPPSLAAATIDMTATDANGGSLLCVNLSTAPENSVE